MADSVPVSDVVCVDDMGKARVMEPVLADKVSNLKDQCADFLNGCWTISCYWVIRIFQYSFSSDIELYRNAVDSFINVMDHLAKQVEREKLDAIIASNKLASLSNKTNEEVAILQVRVWYKLNVIHIYYLIVNFFPVTNRTKDHGTWPPQDWA